MPSRRVERVSHNMREVISELLLREVKDPRVAMVTVSHVDVSPDLRQARVLVSCIGEPDQRAAALVGLNRAAGFLRGQLGKRLHLRYAPDLRFAMDESFEYAARVSALLHGTARGGDENEDE